MIIYIFFQYLVLLNVYYMRGKQLSNYLNFLVLYTITVKDIQ